MQIISSIKSSHNAFYKTNTFIVNLHPYNCTDFPIGVVIRLAGNVRLCRIQSGALFSRKPFVCVWRDEDGQRRCRGSEAAGLPGDKPVCGCNEVSIVPQNEEIFPSNVGGM